MIRVIEETFAEDHGPRVRWYVMTDDDTVLLIDNLVSVLSKYDHTKYYYVGMNSECVVSNFGNSFQMAFGGAGYALSYPLAQAVAKNMDTCSSNTWAERKSYINSWWKPNITRGYLYLDRTPNEHLPWPIAYPPYRIYSDNSRYAPYNKHAAPFAIRMIRVIEETFAEDHGPRVRWYVMTDDDTVLLIDNLVSVLSKYDHTKYYYVGMNSECVVSNFGNSFQMAFGGAGYALSYPLAQAVAKNMDTCIKSYPNVYGSDHMLQACIADLGVTITLEKGFHQIDLHNDISGFLSAHPQSPFLSIHHLDAVDPIFPSMNRFEALNHLMKAANVDQSRLLQQSTCYNKKHNWTFSVSWGYSVQIYDKIHAQSYIAMPIETFGEWRKGAWPPYMFNVRGLKSNNGNSCGEVPNILFFDSLEGTSMNHVVTTYVKKTPRSCGSSGNDDHSIDGILKIHVFSPIHKLHVGLKIEPNRNT
ncbi:hypothetical protein BC332_01221 [Capsicum chinense]|nr:hypothetical protein BC332_01221 [Capsicum chinense]